MAIVTGDEPAPGAEGALTTVDDGPRIAEAGRAA